MIISNLKFFILGGGYFRVNFGHLKSEVFHWGGGYFGVNFSHIKSEVFHWGGYFGVYFGHIKSEVFHLEGGYFGVSFGHLKSEVFHGGGELSGLKFQKGAFWRIWTKFTVQPETCLCITDSLSHSLSHTTYVETNYQWCYYLQ